MDKEKIMLEVKFNKILQSVFLNDFRVGGCKWNDIDNGQVIKLSVNMEDLFHELKKTECFKKYITQTVKEFAEKLKADLNNAYVNATNPFQAGKNAGIDNALILIDECIEKSCVKGES